MAHWLWCALLLAGPAAGTPTTYAFDTVRSVQLDRNMNVVTGIERNTGVVITASFLDAVSNTYQFVVNRCVPLLMTALEKPGRYYLYVTVDPDQISLQLVGCRLEVKQ
jgi:hypothetical protein